MMKNLKSRSPYIGHALMAIALSLVCNFSYLLLLVSSQTGTSGNRRVNSRAERGQETAIIEGKLSISEDGFGYIVTEQADSIYVDHRNLHRLNLADGDKLVVQAAKRRNFEAKHLYMQRVIERNGKEFSYGALYRGSEQWTALLYQLIFYFAISFILLSVMSPNRRDYSRYGFILRATICLLIVTATYFISPVPNMFNGEVIPAYKSRQIVEFIVVLKACFMLAMVLLYSLLLTFINREQQISLENEKLRSENLTTKYNMLISQTNPHFLFNSLSSLSMLVREKDEERALNYIDQLCYTFRYLAQNGANATFVTLREEIHFAEAYSYLFKIRYADKIAFDSGDVRKHFIGNFRTAVEDTFITDDLSSTLHGTLAAGGTGKTDKLIIFAFTQKGNCKSTADESGDSGQENFFHRSPCLGADTTQHDTSAVKNKEMINPLIYTV